MKSTTFALGLLAGVASAAVPAHHPHPRFLHQHWRRSNETAYPTTDAAVAPVAVGASTTLTVELTETQTITSCAPTITNCPVNASNGTAIVTQVVAITTVVCPVTEVPAVSSSVVSDYSKGVITGAVTSTVLPTGSQPAVGYPTGPAPPPAGATVTPSTSVHDQTLTMTIGPSSSQSVIVTTIHSTYTEMVTVKVPMGGNGGNGGGAPPASEDLTTTTTMTTTGTRTVTVESPSSTTENSPVLVPMPSGEATYPTAPVEGAHGGSNVGTGNGDSAECVAVTVTVTATQQVAPQTVYVTMTAPAPAVPTKEGEADDECDVPATATSANSPETASAPSSVASASSSQSAAAVPYPTGPAGNGTQPILSTGGLPSTTPLASYPTIAVKPRDVFGRN